ncbi:ISL3 family transposase [Exiguobacterium sp. s192]|uniref:ISL3 family transposase n=1 Tax=Exiguobacterium sp. s192 TaxID=2751206 RepID=UPI001BEA67C4|nr:ISL3 family transposase [Exiguobacterium sp. s192]
MNNHLNLTMYRIKDWQEDESNYNYLVETISSPPACPMGCYPDFYNYGRKKQLYMDTTMHNKRVGITVDRRRYRCKQCNYTFWEELPDMDDVRFMTSRLVHYIRNASLKRTFTSIAEEIGIDEKTVRNIFRDYVTELEAETQFETPKWLGLDEIHILKKPRFVVTNIKHRTVVDILRNRELGTVTPYLASLPDRERIEYVTIDMWNPYRTAVNQVLPQATIVIDKFHVVKKANEALEKFRRSHKKDLPTKQRRQLMRDRWVLLSRKRDLTPQDIFLLETWTMNFPMLAEAYELKEELFDIWDLDKRVEAYHRFHSWKQKIPKELKPHFQEILTASENWEEEFFAYFDSPKLTNAYTEGLNSLIRQVNRMGRGYSFEALRAKILFTEGFRKEHKTRYSKRSDMSGVFGHALGNYGSWNVPDYLADVPVEVPLGADISTLVRIMESGEF